MNQNPMLEALEERLQFAVTAAFAAASGILSVVGDELDNNITISRNTAGRILVNGGAVAIDGGTPTVTNTSLISVSGLGGNDTITFIEAKGALPAGQLFGGAGDDQLTGGSGADQLFGGAGNDVLTGGIGDDQVFDEAGDDRLVWNNGDGSDLNEGGDGVDTILVFGGNGSETFSVNRNGTRVRFDRLDPAPFFLDIGTSENLVLAMNGGDDKFVGSNGLASLMDFTVDGGAGNDTLLGTDGNDLLTGGDGDDLVDGNIGADTALLGAGNDTFQWDPGDGSDVVEGQGGNDTMQFNGSNAAENIDLSANGTRLSTLR